MTQVNANSLCFKQKVIIYAEVSEKVLTLKGMDKDTEEGREQLFSGIVH